MKILKRFFLGMLPVLAGVATAATFNLFQPATGILKGNASTYVTTAATSTDIVGTFTGTCNNGTYLRGDGSCNTPPGTGVSSIGLTMPTGFSVAGSPVTSSGTLAVSTTLSGVLHGNGTGFTASNVLLGSEVSGTLPVGNGGTGATTLTGVLHGNGTAGFTAANVALGSEVSGTLAVGNGGTGATTLTGLLKGNGTSAFTVATSADVIGLWSGTCNASSFLRGDGACAAAGTGSVTSVGLTMPGVFSVTGSPVTTSGTLAVAASGTSGGIPYFSGATTMASSAALAANQLVLGGGAGTTPATLGSLGTTTTVLHGNAAGAPSFGAVSLTADVTGTLPVGNGGTGVTTSTGSGSVVLSASPTFTGTVNAATIAATTVTVGGNNVCQSTGTNCPTGSATIVNAVTAGNVVRNNTSSPTTDTYLTGMSLAANGIYRIDGALYVTQVNASAGFRATWSCSAGSQTAGIFNLFTMPSSGTTIASATDNTTQQIGVAQPTGTFAGTVLVTGFITAGASGCTLDFQWAQNSAQAANTTLLTGSSLSLIKLN